MENLTDVRDMDLRAVNMSLLNLNQMSTVRDDGSSGAAGEPASLQEVICDHRGERTGRHRGRTTDRGRGGHIMGRSLKKTESLPINGQKPKCLF